MVKNRYLGSLRKKHKWALLLPDARGDAEEKEKQHQETMLLSSEDPRKSSFDLQKDLQRSGVKISATTVRRKLLEAGRKARKPLKSSFSPTE